MSIARKLLKKSETRLGKIFTGDDDSVLSILGLIVDCRIVSDIEEKIVGDGDYGGDREGVTILISVSKEEFEKRNIEPYPDCTAELNGNSYIVNRVEGREPSSPSYNLTLWNP